MSSPNPLLGSFVNAATTAGMDQMGANICSWITGATGGIIDLSSWSSQLRTDATNAVTGITGGLTDSTQVAPTMSGVQGNLKAHSAAIAALQGASTQTSTSGAATPVTQFNTAQSGTLGSNFTLLGESAGTWEVNASTGAYVQHNSGEGPTVKFGLSTTQMLTDGHQAVAVVGGSVNNITSTGLVVRAASDASTFVYAAVLANSAAIGWGTWVAGTSTLTLHPWTGASGLNVVQGNTVALTASGQTYTLTINQTQVCSHTDTVPNSPVGFSNRYLGFFGSTGSNFGTWYSGWPVSQFNGVDVTPPTYVGSGWHIYCSNTSGVAVPGSSWGGVGAGTYDTEGPITNDITVSSLGYGVIQVSVEGWYSITSMGYMNLAPSSATPFNPGLYIRPAATGTNAIARYGPDSTMYSHQLGFTWGSVYLKSGDQVSPAFRQNGSNSLVGDALGLQTYFSGTLVSKA